MKNLSPHLFVSLVEQTADAVFVLRVLPDGLNFVMEYANPAYFLKFNETAERLVGKNVQEFLSPEKYRLVYERLSACVNSKTALCYEEIIVLDDKTLISLSEAFPIMNTTGEVEYVVGLSKDITELKQQELQIQKHIETLRSIARIQSHEIRRPVANIIGLTDLIDPDKPISETREVIAHLRKSTLELDELVKQIITKTNDYIL